MFALVITGPPGSGKTAVLTALADALADDGVAHAAVEAEALAMAHPPLPPEQRARHVAALCALHREAGHELLLVADTLATDADRRRLLAAVGADAHALVRLDGPPATVAERVLRREPEHWSGRDAIAAHARTLALTMRELPGVDLVLGTEGERPAHVAARLRAALPGLLTPAG